MWTDKLATVGAYSLAGWKIPLSFSSAKKLSCLLTGKKHWDYLYQIMGLSVTIPTLIKLRQTLRPISQAATVIPAMAKYYRYIDVRKEQHFYKCRVLRQSWLSLSSTETNCYWNLWTQLGSTPALMSPSSFSATCHELRYRDWRATLLQSRGWPPLDLKAYANHSEIAFKRQLFLAEV